MTKGTIKTNVESNEYNYFIINTLMGDKDDLKDAIKELLNAISEKHPMMHIPEDEKLYMAYHNAKKLL